ncbi:MAG: hypothetical protein ABI151_07255 [Chitinophagaceae bacterium]
MMKLLIFLLQLFLLNTSATAQEKKEKDAEDSTTRAGRIIHNIFSKVRDAITVTPQDSTINAAALKVKSEVPFAKYDGKIIRNISGRQLDFDKNFADTSKRIAYFGTRILNSLHRNSRSWVIMNNIYLNEGTRFNANEVADNERYLRTLNFIQDARFGVIPVKGSADSVDIVVVTKDLFSLSAGLDVSGIQRARGKIGDNNFLGMGQQVQFTLLADKSRRPVLGYEFLYTKYNIGQTFTNASIGYTVINTGRSDGNEDEKAIYFRLDRPLYSQYAHSAGGLEISYNSSENLYHKPDSLFYNYKYNLIDLWGGYNLGVTKLLKSKNKIRDRSFIAGRYINNNFGRKPTQIGDNYDVIYNSRKAFISEITLFRQDFYNTNYVYGFGTTEDVPYGYNLAVTGGWYKQEDRSRAYLGLNANQYLVTDAGAFIQYFVRGGTYLYKKKAEDAVILLGGNLYSRLYLYKRLKIRENIKFSYTRQFNRVALDALRLDNPFGLAEYSSDLIVGKQRISCYAETTVFTREKAIGFKLAPFVFSDLSLLTAEKTSLMGTRLYAGLGAGMRARNENLVFGTMECRFIYFPRPSERTNLFKIAFRSNLRFRYNTLFVKAPDTIRYNVGDPDVY